MTKKQKVAGILAATIVLTAFAGCQPKKAENGENANLTYIMAGPGMQKDSEKVWEVFNQKLAEKGVNATVDFEIIPLSEYKQRFMLMTSAREKMDIANNYGLDFQNEVKNGVFEPLDDLLDKHGKGIKEALPEWFMDYQKIDGKIYGIPSYQMCGIYRGIAFFKEQADKYLDIEAFKKALYSKQTFGNQEMYDILTKYMEDMREDGLKFKSASILNLKGYEPLVSGYNVVLGDKNVKVIYSLCNDIDSYIRFKTARNWYEKGFIREDVISANDNADYKGKIDGFPFWDESYTPFLAQQLSEKYGHEIIVIPYEQKEFIGSKNSAAGTSIVSTSENKEAAMQVLNLLQSDKDMFNLLTFGIEGDHYTKLGDDQIQVEYKGTTQGNIDDRYGLYKWIVGNTEIAYNTQFEPVEYKEWVFNQANKSDWRSPLIGFTPDTSNIQNYLTQVSAITDKYLQPLSSGILPDWEDKFKEFQAELDKVGNKEIIEELQKQVDEFLKNK